MSIPQKQVRWCALIFSVLFVFQIHANDSSESMINVLGASGPHSSLGDQAKVFDRFIGTWDCDYTFYGSDGKVRHSSGELLFGWILDGRAIQDIWISYPTDGTTERTLGTSVRFYDTKTKLWRVIFVAPAFDAVINVQGGAEGNRIILNGNDLDGAPIRWSFNDMKADSFVWRGEKSHDNGNAWVLEEEHHMKRRK
jgi:uncharacterized protein